MTCVCGRADSGVSMGSTYSDCGVRMGCTYSDSGVRMGCTYSGVRMVYLQWCEDGVYLQ